MNEVELKDAMSDAVHILNGRCEFVLGNGCPPGWEVTIIEAGIKFFYTDGTDDTDGPRPLNIKGPDGHASFFSKVPSKCVSQIYGLIKVRAVGEPSDKLFEYRDKIEAGKCFNRTGTTLGPKNSITASEKADGAWHLALELRSA